MVKQIVYEQNAREQLRRGIDQVANAVGVTLGPKGRNVGIGHPYGLPTAPQRLMRFPCRIHFRT